MNLGILSSATDAAIFALVLTCLSLTVSGLEWLQRPPLFASTLGSVVAQAYTYPRVVYLFSVRTVLAVSLIPVAILGNLNTTLALAFGLFVCHSLCQARSRLGMNGADQLNSFVLGAFVLCEALGNGPFGTKAFLVALTAQAILCYFTSGIAKVRGETWRKGSALAGILGTTMYGTPPIGKLLGRSRLAGLGLCWAVMAWEIGFLLVLLGPRPLVLVLLLGGVTFHVGTSILMGLNDFLLSFLAVYPAIFIVCAR